MTKDTPLQVILLSLDSHIATLRSLGCGHAAALLAIAKLELQTKIHGISDDELKAVREAIDNATAPQAQVLEFSRALRKA